MKDPNRLKAGTFLGACLGLSLLAATPGFGGPLAEPPWSFDLASSGWAASKDPEGYAQPAMSRDGRYVAFVSRNHAADPPVADPRHEQRQVFVRDMLARRTELVSVGLAGAASDGDSWDPSMSADGRFITFTSRATNIVRRDTNKMADIFIYDRSSRGITRITDGGTQANGPSESGRISADGRSVAFNSMAFNLDVRDANFSVDTFVYDRVRRRTELVSISPAGGAKVYDPWDLLPPAISADGQRVAFSASGDAFANSDEYSGTTLWVRDRSLRSTVLASSFEEAAFLAGTNIAGIGLSNDGRVAAFQSGGPDVGGSAIAGAFLLDLDTGHIERITVRPDGTPAEHGPAGVGLAVGALVSDLPDYSLHFSGDDRFVGFESDAPDLVTDDGDSAWDAFVFDRQSLTIQRIVAAEGSSSVPLPSGTPVLSGDGSRVALWSMRPVPLAGDPDPIMDVFVATRSRDAA